MSQPSNSAVSAVVQAFSAWLQLHPQKTVVVQLPGMEAITLHAGQSEPLMLSDLQDLTTRARLAELQDHWEQVLIAVRNGEFSHLSVPVEDQVVAIKIVPTNQDS